jgi:hypothetical protein
MTQAQIDAISKQVLEQYKFALDDISGQLEKQYAKLLTGVKPEDYYNEMMKFNRLQKLQDEIAASYKSYSNKAGLLTENASFVGFSNSYYLAQYQASWMSSFSVGILPYQLAEYSVYGMADSWKAIAARKGIEEVYGSASLYKSQSTTLLELLKKNQAEELLKIQNTITQGLLQGKSYAKLVEDIKNVIGSLAISQGEITAKGAMANAMRIIRTESNRTQNAGHYASSKYLDSICIEVQRRIVSVLDNRTRAQSAQMDNKTVGVDEPFMYPGKVPVMYPGNSGVAKWDINDRETTIDIIDGNEPELRRGRNPVTGENETFNYKDFDTWRKENNLIKNKYGEILFPEGK